MTSSSKAFLLLALVAVLVLILISSEVAARDLANNGDHVAEGGVDDAKHDGYGGHGHHGGGYGGRGRNGGRGGYGGGGGGGRCAFGCCRSDYYGRGCLRCCSYRGQAVEAPTQADPHN